MKLGYGILFSLVFLVFIGCGSSEKNSKNQHSNFIGGVPRYDSLNWKKEYQFKPSNLSEKASKQRVLNQFYQDFWVKSNASGGMIVAQHGEIIFEAYNGSPNFETKAIMDAQTPIHIASISKVLTSLAVLKLVENDKIKLHDKVSEYLKGFPYKDVRIEDLLNHRSGLPNYLSFSEDPQYWDRTKIMSNQDVLNILIQKHPAAFMPADKKFFYNNTNYVLLALIIEKITGMTYPKAMKYMVFDPLGMKNTFVLDYDKDAGKTSKSYYGNGRDWGYDHLDKTYGDKNIYSTPRDLLKMDIAMYSSKFLPEKLKKKAWKAYSHESKGVKNYGLGMRMMEWPDNSKILYHNGKWHGNNTVYVRNFENETTIIALSNRQNRNIYASFKLVGLFGNYPIPMPSKNKVVADEHSL